MPRGGAACRRPTSGCCARAIARPRVQEVRRVGTTTSPRARAHVTPPRQKARAAPLNASRRPTCVRAQSRRSSSGSTPTPRSSRREPRELALEPRPRRVPAGARRPSRAGSRRRAARPARGERAGRRDDADPRAAFRGREPPALRRARGRARRGRGTRARWRSGGASPRRRHVRCASLSSSRCAARAARAAAADVSARGDAIGQSEGAARRARFVFDGGLVRAAARGPVPEGICEMRARVRPHRTACRISRALDAGRQGTSESRRVRERLRSGAERARFLDCLVESRPRD